MGTGQEARLNDPEAHVPRFLTPEQALYVFTIVMILAAYLLSWIKEKDE